MDIKVNTMESFTREKKEFIRSNLHHKGPDDQKKKYYHLLKKNQLAIGQRVLDQEREQPQIHQMDLKTTEPIFVKQCKIRDAHAQEMERQVVEWFKRQLIEPAGSKYYSPLFVLKQNKGGGRIVQDCQALND